jgi:hypothetical protein
MIEIDVTAILAEHGLLNAAMPSLGYSATTQLTRGMPALRRSSRRLASPGGMRRVDIVAGT